MPLYILSNKSYIKDNLYKFGYSKKNKEELLFQYKKNKRIIVEPFIIKWWDIESCIKIEKKIHSLLNKNKNIENTYGEWYRCNKLSYLLEIINEEIIKNHNIEKTEKILIKKENLCKYDVFKYMIENNINLSIKNYINNLDDYYLNDFINFTSLNKSNIGFFNKRIFDHIYINKINDSDNNFLKKIKKKIYKSLKRPNIIFFIYNICIDSFCIEIEFNNYKKEFTMAEYQSFIKRNIKTNILNYRIVLNFYAEFAFITNNNVMTEPYNLKNIYNKNLIEIIDNDDLYEIVNVYFNNKEIIIRKYTLYQLLQRINK